MEFKNFVSLEDTLELSKKFKFNSRNRNVPVLNSVGHYSFSDIYSPDDFPSFSKSAVDGFAIFSNSTISSTRTNPSFFKIIGESSPEKDFDGSVKEGEAIRIYTGGKMPEGTDAVVMMEDTEELNKDLKVFVPVRKFQNVSLRGEDIKKGFKIIGKGERITPPHLVAFIEVGIKNIEVYDLSVGIISTGDEIVSGKVKNSTQPFLAEFLRWNGFEPTLLGSVKDDEASIKKTIDSSNNDIIIVTGGTGPSDKDVLTNFLDSNAVKIFHGIKIRPARTTGLYIYNEKPIFIVSGLPVASLIAMENVFLPIVSQWTGIKRQRKFYEQGILARSLVNTLGFRSFVRVKLDRAVDPPLVYPIRVTGSGVIYSILDADGILEMGENIEGMMEGENVMVQILRW